MNDHDPALGCGYLIVGMAVVLLVLAVVAAFAIRDGLVSLTAGLPL